ncbi:MAG: hypothetical protein E6H08_04570 [Bacteroidetes bacterium]|nr:MAG: hypothetical protein E6H08_04570 [Bacteroidota bacterium]
MKKIFLLLVSAATMTTMMGQHARLNFYAAYTFDDGFDVVNDANTYYNGTVKAGVQWGGGLEYMFSHQSSAELLYLHRSTTVPANFKFGGNTQTRKETFDLKHDFIMLSGDGHFGSGGKAEGYAGVMAGVLLSHLEAPSLGKSSSNTNFAWGGRVGTNVWFSPKMGLKLQAMILSASRATGGDYYWSWYGPIYLTTYSTLWQFSLGGGLTFKLGK